MIIASDMACVYKVLNAKMENAGKFVSPRGMGVKELFAQQIVLTNPRQRLAYLPERKFSIVYAVVESLLLALCENRTIAFSYFNKAMGNFSDNGKTMHGAYGYRISPAVNDIIKKLKSDKDSRQAVLTIYNHEKDLCNYNGKDVPCTLSLQFLVRDDKLNMIVTMRSNDAVLGLPYDIYNFTNFQEVIANTLGIDVGTYVHQVGSLHVYENQYDIFRDMQNAVAIKAENKANLQQWNMQARMLREITLEKHSVLHFNTAKINLGMVFNGANRLQNEDVHLNIILNELLHRKGDVASHAFPGFAKSFVKRWNVV